MFNLGVIYMKKSLVALAALAATGAFAQSSVTLYGRIDAGLFNQTTENQAVGSKVTKFDLAGAQNTKTGARLGVTGVEDLGGGLKAGFVIETRVNIDKSTNIAGGAAQGTFGATRQANINLNGGFGTVVLGTYYNAFDDLRYAHSPNIGGLAGGDTFGTFGGRLSERSENALGYSTPSFGGFKIRASVLSRKNNGDLMTPGTSALGLTSNAGSGGIATLAPTAGQKTQGFGAAAGYDNGPLSVLGVFGTAKQNFTAAGTPLIQKTNDYGFTVKYDFGVAVPYFIFEDTKTTNSTAGFFAKSRGFEVGAKFPLGAFTPYVTFNAMKNNTNAAGSTDKIRALQIGTNYDISKRTSAYVALGTDKTKNDTAATFTKRNGVALGLVHKF
jgi:predicted porin